MKLEGYDILSTIGTGGMGTVFKAQHQMTKKIVAIKLLRDLKDRRRFENEARIQANIRHPNICRLYTVGESNGKPFLVMEYVEGISLEEYLKNHREVALIEKLGIFKDICEAVAIMHEAGVIHRDLKPGNIKITESGIVKILDFGIARGLSTPKFTATGQLIGSVHYVAPERFNGQCTIQSDIWSLGVILYLIATGKLPFESDDTKRLLSSIKKAQYRTANRINPDISAKLKSIIDKCLQQDPRKRYRDARMLSDDLDKKVINAPITAKRELRFDNLKQINRKILLGSTAIFIVILLAFLIPNGTNQQKEMGVLCITVQNAKNYKIKVNGKSCNTGCECYVPMDAVSKVVIRANGYKKFEEQVRIYKTRSHLTAIMELK